jgi:2-iminobutanoate/2-iminopropanoate deaminase
MSYRTISSPDTPGVPPKTWSNMKVHPSGHFHISGMAALGDTMYEQAKKTFGYIRSTLEAAGGKMDDIVSMQVFVTNLDENEELWRARREFFTGDFPCSTLVQVMRVGDPKAQPPMRVEINCTGYIGGSN